MKIAFIINPQAANGSAMSRWDEFSKKVEFPYEQFVTQYPGHAMQIVAELKKRQQELLVIGFGGDGTMREVASAAAGAKQLLVASVPAGSGNDFSRTFSSFSSALQIQRFINQPAGIPTDLGEVTAGTEQQFAGSSGIGFDAAVAQAVNNSRIKQVLNKIGLGKTAYPMFVISVLFSFKTFRLTVERNGTVFHYDDVWLATVSNQPYFGGGMKISPQSSPYDGLLELTVVHRLTRLKLLAVFGTVFSGRHTKFEEVVQLSGDAFVLTTDGPVPRHIDGDDAGTAASGEQLEYRIAEEKWQQAKL